MSLFSHFLFTVFHFMFAHFTLPGVVLISCYPFTLIPISFAMLLFSLVAHITNALLVAVCVCMQYLTHNTTRKSSC